MRRIIRSRVAAITAGALVLVGLGGLGGASAAGLIGGEDIRNQSVKKVDVGSNAVGGSELTNGSVHLNHLSAAAKAGSVKRLESDGPYPGATQLGDNRGNGQNSTAKWVGDSGATLQSSWVRCAGAKTALGGGYSRADEGAAAQKGLQIVSSQPVQIEGGDPTTYNPIGGDAAGSVVPNGWLVEGFNNNADGELIVRPWVICAAIR